MQKIFLYDTTLRDGTQGEDVSFSVEDKIRIARELDEIGVHYIEGGWPGSNPKDMEFFQRAASLQLRHGRIAAFGSTCRAGNKAENDPNLQALIEASTPTVTIFGKTSLMHVFSALGINEEENLSIISDSVNYLKKHGREVVYDAEHFFDGYKENRQYALETLRRAQHAGANVIVLCDTNGGTLPHEVAELFGEVKKFINIPLGIHAHNDCELGVANTIVAVQSGAVHVQGTVNGYGERCGNANLCSVIPNLQLKMGYSCIDENKMKNLSRLSRTVSELANLAHRKHLPYVGDSAFAHKGGVHVSAVMKKPETYEHVHPESVGNRRRVLVSDLSGKSNVLYKARELGIKLDDLESDVQDLVQFIKQREHEGYSYENADGSFEVLVRQHTKGWTEYFDLGGFKVINHQDANGSQPVSEAIIKVVVNNEEEMAAAEGTGPVNALDSALRKALCKFYPQLNDMYLSDYKVRVIDEHAGTKAKVRVLITSRNGKRTWNTVGVSTNIIEASYKALVDSIYFYLMKTVVAELKTEEATV
jgi:2-isopropylmalate synthase